MSEWGTEYVRQAAIAGATLEASVAPDGPITEYDWAVISHQCRVRFNAWLVSVKAEALREAAEGMRGCKSPGHWNLQDPGDWERAYSPDCWLENRADRIEAGL